MARGLIALTAAILSLAGIVVIQSLTHPGRAQDGQGPSSEALLPPLVFIHGIKGSILSRRNGLRAWITFRQALGLASADLRLPLRWDGEVQRRDELVVEGPIETVAWRDIYGRFLDWASGSGRAFYTFAYDWRRDNLETVDQFTAFLVEISKRHRRAKVQVVAHSMGGLVSFVALNRSKSVPQPALRRRTIRLLSQFPGGHARRHCSRSERAYPESPDLVHLCFSVLLLPV